METEDLTRIRILAVDDDDSLIQMLNLLYGGAHQIDRAADRAEAEALLLKERYDVLLLDVNLPDGLGVDLLRSLRETPRFHELRALPVIMLTASQDGQVYEDAWDLGSLAYVRKPFEVTELSQALDRAIAIARAPAPPKVEAPPPPPPPASASVSPMAALRHDLLNPVNQIFGYSDLLNEQLAELTQAPDDKLRAALAADLGRIRAAGQQILTTIEAHLPSAVPRLAAAPAPRSAEPAAPARVHSDRESAALGDLLVVDDDPGSRELLVRNLQQRGHRVTATESGARALALLGERPFDLMLLDMVMPEMDGLAVLQRVRADDSLRPMPVIMISALSELDSVVRCIELGAEDYLPKPTSPVLLQARIGACLDKKRLRDRERRLYAELDSNYQRLRALEQLRDDLASMLIHDLRTPLSSLMTGLQALPMVGHLDPRQEKLLHLALRGGQTLLHMINDLLDISRLEDSSQPLDTRPLGLPPIAEQVDQALTQVAPLLRNRGLRVQRTGLLCDPTPGALRGAVVHADAALLQRVLVNLLGNAVKFSPQDGCITIGLQHSGSRLCFSVKDTGPGIPRDSFDIIFDKFAVVAARQKGQTPSTGLGLHFCRMVVEAHGGTIWVESELGQGSTFFFALPLRAS